MAPSNPLIISSSTIYLLPGSYHFQTIFGVDRYIFIVLGQSNFFLLHNIYFHFNFHEVESSIQRWFPINSDTLYKMKWVVIPLYCIFIPPWPIIKSNNFGCFC